MNAQGELYIEEEKVREDKRFLICKLEACEIVLSTGKVTIHDIPSYGKGFLRKNRAGGLLRIDGLRYEARLPAKNKTRHHAKNTVYSIEDRSRVEKVKFKLQVQLGKI